MFANQDDPQYDVAVAGLGPVGLLATVLLGQKGHRVIGFDRWPTPYPLPRAVTFDHEIARILASVGIDANADPAINFYDDRYIWQNAAGETLMEIDWLNTANDGWRNRYWFNQPSLEARLREIAASLPNVTLMPGYEVGDFTQTDTHVDVRFHETRVEGTSVVPQEGGRTDSVRSRFVIGSDGANSVVRQRLGLELVDLDFYYDWLVVDVLPTERLTFTPAHFQVCDPARPHTVVPGGPGPRPGTPDRRRWEFMALPGEDSAELASTEKTWQLLEPYGVTPDNAELEKSVVWRFQAKYLEEWRVGRVALAGDAAHQMPPFAGEGMCAGLRDVTNLAWRLDLALRRLAEPRVLDGYTQERRDHVRWYIDFSVDIGKVICVADAEEASARDERMVAEHRARAGQGPISPHDAVLGEGAWVSDDPLAGVPGPQGRVAYRGRTGRFDDAVGRGWVLISTTEHADALTTEQRATFEWVGGLAVTVGPAGSGADVIDCGGVYGDWLRDHDLTHVLIRPDFHIAATAPDDEHLRRVFDRVTDRLALTEPALT